VYDDDDDDDEEKSGTLALRDGQGNPQGVALRKSKTFGLWTINYGPVGADGKGRIIYGNNGDTYVLCIMLSLSHTHTQHSRCLLSISIRRDEGCILYAVEVVEFGVMNQLFEHCD
jgi:hypothetical protein